MFAEVVVPELWLELQHLLRAEQHLQGLSFFLELKDETSGLQPAPSFIISSQG